MSNRAFSNEIRCSFCGKISDAVKRLIAGPDSIYICNECIKLCTEVLMDEPSLTADDVLPQAVIKQFSVKSASETSPRKKSRKGLLVNPIFGSIPEDSQYSCDVFMLMPFKDDLRSVYDDHVRKVVSELQLSIRRADDFFSQHSIMTDIWAGISTARLIIGDCTDRNPNVFYELGIAHMYGKPTIMITQKPEDVPFDLRHYRYIVYENSPRGMQKFERELKAGIIRLLKIED